MKRTFSFVFAVSMVAITLAVSQEAPVLKIEDMAFCTGVENREPVAPADTFAASVDRVFCFSRILGAEQPTSVAHVWYYHDQEMARVDLAVNSVSWRTWSSKQIAPDQAGEWRVDVVAFTGEVLLQKRFVVRAE